MQKWKFWTFKTIIILFAQQEIKIQTQSSSFGRSHNIPRTFRDPARAPTISFVTSKIASSLLRPFLNPNWLLFKIVFCPKLFVILSNIFEATGRIYIGPKCSPNTSTLYFRRSGNIHFSNYIFIKKRREDNFTLYKRVSKNQSRHIFPGL